MSNLEQEQFNHTTELISKANIDTIKDEINDIFNSLVTEKDNAVLPENLFVSNFLPFFSGQRDIKSERQFMSNWIGVAGSPTREVDIIDGRGQILYTVPSLFNTNMIETVTKVDDTRLSQVIQNYEQTKNDFPIPANDKVSIDLSHKLKESLGSVDNVVLNQTTQRWNNIFNRYDIKPITANDTKPEEIKKDNLNDEFEYD